MASTPIAKDSNDPFSVKAKPSSSLSAVQEAKPPFDVFAVDAIQVPDTPPDAALLASVKKVLREEKIQLWLVPHSNPDGSSSLTDATLKLISEKADLLREESDPTVEYLRAVTFNKKLSQLKNKGSPVALLFPACAYRLQSSTLETE